MKKCVIVQFEARHEVVIPSLVAACNRIGYRPTVFVHAGCLRRRGDIMLETPLLDYHIEYLPLSQDIAVDQVSEVCTQTEIEFIIVATYNRKRVAHWVRKFSKPVIPVVHNLDQLMSDPGFHEAIKLSHVRFLTLGHHVASEMIRRLGREQMDDIGVLEFVYWGEQASNPQSNGFRRVAIPGAVSLRTRDYSGLLDLLRTRTSKFQNIGFVIASGGKDRPSVEAQIAELGLGEQLTCIPVEKSGQVHHKAHFDVMRNVQLLHPLMPYDYDQYRQIKITSVIPTSVGFTVPVILDRWSAACYRLPALQSDFGLEESLTVLSEISDEELVALRSNLSIYRTNSLAEGAAELKRLIER